MRARRAKATSVLVFVASMLSLGGLCLALFHSHAPDGHSSSPESCWVCLLIKHEWQADAPAAPVTITPNRTFADAPHERLPRALVVLGCPAQRAPPSLVASF